MRTLLDCINLALASECKCIEEALLALRIASYDDKVNAFDFAISNNSLYSTPLHLPFSQQKLAPHAKVFTDICRGRA